MKIASIVGARPQFIKLAPLSKALAQLHDEIIIHTGQHYDDAMSNTIFSDLNIRKPDYNLNIGSGSHGQQTGLMLIEIEKILMDLHVDLVIVFGDTNSTTAGALVAAKLQIPVVHIEAGLRSYNRTMPEEINRIATDHIANYLFAPTKNAEEILKNEGLADKTYLTGDIMADTITSNINIAKEKSDILNTLNLNNSDFYLVTLHRPYNVDEPESLQKIFDTLAELDDPVIFPVHPRTRNIINRNNLKAGTNTILTEPLGYLDFICLEHASKKILTDSGGIQKEAYILKKPCITFRPETEWVETLRDGWNMLLDPRNKESIEKIIGFKPSQSQSGVFGTNVTEKMLKVINSI